MRIKVIQRPNTASIDGLRLDRFEPGFQYDVGTSLGALFLAERWAVPVASEEPALVVPFSETDPAAETPDRDARTPANVAREQSPRSLNDRVDVAAPIERNKHRRR
jgi:hypothetical protein